MGWKGSKGETYVYVWLIHVDVWQKPTQYSNYPSIKNKLKKKLVEIPVAKKITTDNMLVHPSGLFITGFLTSHLFLLI